MPAAGGAPEAGGSKEAAGDARPCGRRETLFAATRRAHQVGLRTVWGLDCVLRLTRTVSTTRAGTPTCPSASSCTAASTLPRSRTTWMHARRYAREHAAAAREVQCTPTRKPPPAAVDLGPSRGRCAHGLQGAGPAGGRRVRGAGAIVCSRALPLLCSTGGMRRPASARATNVVAVPSRLACRAPRRRGTGAPPGTLATSRASTATASTSAATARCCAIAPASSAASGDTTRLRRQRFASPSRRCWCRCTLSTRR